MSELIKLGLPPKNSRLFLRFTDDLGCHFEANSKIFK